MSIFGAIATAGTILGVLGQNRAAQENSRIASRNRSLLRQQALIDRNQAKAKVAQLYGLERRMLGEQRAAFAGQNVDVGFGSPATIAEETSRAIAQDIRTVKNNAALSAWGYDNELESLALQARYERQRLPFDIATTILGGAVNIATIGSLGGRE